MSYLDNNGLVYFYNKLKEKFIRTITAGGDTLYPDSSGNVTVSNVATANNLTAPDAQASYGDFIYRTSGGTASLDSGTANLVYVDGNSIISDRKSEEFIITTDLDIDITYSAEAWDESQFNITNTYVFNYVRPTYPSSSVSTWTPNIGEWKYNNNTISLSSIGIFVTGVTAPILNINLDAVGVLGATIVPSVFFPNITNDALLQFTYSEDTSVWLLNGEETQLATYGITYSGTPINGDVITVSATYGTPNGILTVVYQAPEQGTITIATPTAFSATGFNQFDKNTMVLNNAAFFNGTIVQNTGTIACYCRAKGGVDNGYVAYSANGAILDIGWCATIPAYNETIITENASVTNTLASIPFNDDGYVVVIVTVKDDICIHPKWTGKADEEYKAYVAPSVITFPTVGILNGETQPLPSSLYGMPRIGSVSDRLNLDTQTYIQAIGQYDYSVENLLTVQSYCAEYNTEYDYDNNNIFYVLATPQVYTVVIDSEYIVDDFGTEEFIGTTVPLSAQLLYGQNLRDKLRTDVVTISSQVLDTNQKQQINTNIGSVQKAGDTMTGTLYTNGNFYVKKIGAQADTSLTAPTSQTTWTTGHLDKNSKYAAYWQTLLKTTGEVQTAFYNRRIVNGKDVSNGLNLLIDKDGKRSVTVSEQGIWRKALGLGSSTGALPITVAQGGTGQTAITKVTTISSVITVNTANATVTAAQYVQFGKIAQIYISWKNVNAITVPAGGNITNVGIGTLVSGKRPAILTGAWSHGDNGGAAWYNLGTSGSVALGACEATGTARTIAAGTVFTCFATYILA